MRVHVPDKYNILLCRVLFLQCFLCKIDVHILNFFNVHNRRQFLQKGQTKFTKQYRLTSETSVFEIKGTGL